MGPRWMLAWMQRWVLGLLRGVSNWGVRRQEGLVAAAESDTHVEDVSAFGGGGFACLMARHGGGPTALCADLLTLVIERCVVLTES